MSRPRRRAPRLPAGMPVQLVVLRFEDWHDPAWDADYEPGGDFQRYLAWQRWQEARRRWMNGEPPEPAVKTPRPVAAGSANTSPIPESAMAGNPATPHRGPHHPVARVIKP